MSTIQLTTNGLIFQRVTGKIIMDTLRQPMAHKYLKDADYAPMWSIAADIDKCQNCYLCDMPHVLWKGNPYARIALVGQCPGKQEHIKGVPWCGPAGQLLDRAFESVDLPIKDSVFITNIVKARPIAPTDSGRENIDPNKESVRLCSTFVYRELAAMKGLEVVLVAGKIAAVGLGIASQHEPMYKLSGSVRSLNVDGKDIPTITIYHTAAILHNKDVEQDAKMRWSIYNALKLARKITFKQ